MEKKKNTPDFVFIEKTQNVIRKESNALLRTLSILLKAKRMEYLLHTRNQ